MTSPLLKRGSTENSFETGLEYNDEVEQDMLGDTSKSFDPNETAKSKQSKPKADSALGNLNTEKAQVKK